MAACDHLGFNVFYHTYQNYWNDLCRYNTPDISYDQFLTGVSMTYALFPPKAQLFSDYQTQLLNSCFSGGSSSSDPGTYVTGGTANGTNDTLVFTNSTGGTFTVANSALLFNDAFVSGGTLDTTTGCVTFKNTSGGTFQVCGFDGFTSYWTANTDGSISTSGMSSINVSGDVKTSGKILLGDGSVSDTYAGFGNSADLKIFHNGSHSIIRETGTGNLYLQSDNNVILSKDSSTEAMVKGIADGAVELYHDNVKKLETTDTGVEVTGNLTASTALFAPIITGTTGIINGNLGVSGRTLLGTIDAAGDSYSEDKILVAQGDGEIEYLTTAELKADIADADYWSANTDGTISTSGMSGVNVSGDVKTTESVEATQGFKAGDAVGIAAKANLLTRLEFNGANTIDLLANDSNVIQIEPALISMQQDIAVTNAKKLYWNDVNTYIKGTATEIEIDGDDTVKIIADHDVTVNSGRLGITGKTIMGTVDAAGNAYTNNKILVVQSDGEVEYLTSQQIANLNSGTTKYWTGSTEQANSIVNSGMTLTKVGIGTAKPLKPLTVKGDISGSTAIYLGNHTNFISGETSTSGDLTIHSGDDIELYAGDDIVLNTDCRVKFTYLTGTTAPHLHPGIEFSLDDSPGNCLILNGQENTVIAVTSADTRLYFNDIGGEYIVGDGTDLTIASGADIILTPTVNVGIGTTTPQKKLDIAGGDIRLDNSKSIFFATTDGNIGRVAITGDESSDFIQLKVDNSNNHILRLNTTGVGIGTSVPNEKLTVVGNVSASTSIFAPIISGTTALVNGNLGVSGNSIVTGDLTTDGILYTDDIRRLTDNSTSTRIQLGGNNLYIYAGSATNAHVNFRSTFGTVFNDGGQATYDFRVEGDTDTHLIFADAGTDKVGIGTTAANEKLTVVGNISASTSIFSPIISGTTALVNGNLGVSGRTLLGTIDAAGASYSTDKILVAQSNGEVEYLTKAQLQEDISSGYWSANTDGSISTSGMSSINVSGDVKTTGTLYVASKVELAGDSDTFIQFAEDAIGITAGGEQLITISESGQDIVKIGDGGDVDFQVRTENDDNTLYIVGETDNVGIGTNSPIGKLDVNGGVNVTGDTTMLGQLIVSGTGENLMSGDLNMEGGNIVIDNTKKVAFKNTAGTEFGNILMNGSNNMIFQNARTGSDILIRAGGSGSGDTIFTTNQSGTDTEIMIVKGETTHLLGGVGIKTSLPNEALTVVGNISASTSVFSPIISGTTSLVNGNLGVTGNTLISGELGIGTAPSAALHISTADNVLTKLVSTDSIATIELGDNSTSNQAVLTRVSNDLKICKDGGNVGLPIAPKTKLDVQHNPTSLSNNTGGGESVTFGTASGSLTQGKLYYLNTSGVWTSTQANASSSNGSNQLLGIALGTAVSDGLLIRGFFDMHSYLTGTFNEGIPLYVCETTAGNINVAAPGATNEFVRVVGYCTNTSKVIYFNPDGTYITVA